MLDNTLSSERFKCVVSMGITLFFNEIITIHRTVGVDKINRN